ncbi:pentatricopeptide repeat-containing protein At1g10910, chloroplastic isoform X2 [Magnolia sinica]|uniref:pentatricopeptide repeat-containing protein At1g10910, chloroplastic isoform X2 n=1 Tax=Magnolia sinica TaxID=86752 RepID=UPI002659308E|nr:pentatricopeptide repeat-containing protein At1g10910, chloroplastic isoform X2 [Magnolia sinica]
MQSFPAISGFHSLYFHSSPFPPLFFHSNYNNYYNKSSSNNDNKICCLSSFNKTVEKTEPKLSHDSSSSSIAITEKTDGLSFSARRSAVSEVKKSTDLGSALSRFEGTLQVQDLNIILWYFGDLKRWKDVSQLFDWMQKHGKINVASYSSFIKSMGMARDPVKALQVYNSIQDELTRNHVSVCNSVLGCLVKNGKFDSSIRLFEQMKKDGLMPDAVTYSTLLSGCVKVKNGYSKAMHLVQELESSGLHMDTVIYGTLLAICASNNLCQEAEAFFQQMKNEGHSPNIFHYSSLLNAYSVDGNYAKADELLENMKSAGLVPNKMPYCLLMDSLAKAGHIHEAKAIFEEMTNKKVKSDGYSHSIMISAFTRSGLLEEATQLAKDFEASYDKYDLVMLNTLLRAYCRAGEMKSVMQLLKKMDELAISPDGSTFHILIKYFHKEKLYQLAYRMVQDMHSRGHQLDEELCSSLILQLGEAGTTSEAFSVYNMLRYSKRTVCEALHEKMLNILVAGGLLKDAYVVMKDNAEVISKLSLRKFAVAFMKLGNINLINDVVKALHGSGQRIDEAVFRVAVSRYIGQPEKKDLLLQLLQWMTGHGYVVDSSSRNLLLKNSHLFGRQLIAETLSRQHTTSKKLKS